MTKLREVVEQVVYFLFVQVMVAVLIAFPGGLLLMLGVGGLHAWWPDQIPTIDYWSAYWLAALLFLISSIRPSKIRGQR